MAAGVIINLSMYQGEDKTFQDTIYQADGVTPQNITGWNLRFYVHSYGDPTTVFINKTVIGGGIQISNPSAGIALIVVLNADTVNMFPGQYQYVIERTDAGNDGVPTTGLFTILQK